jgi:glycosyltransferase involved in cell wall biosynthesis
LKIAFVSYHYWPPHFGGELLLSIERFQSLVERGHRVDVFTSGIPGMPTEEIMDGLKIYRSPMIHDSRWGRGLRRILFPLWVRWKLKQYKPEIIHYGGVGGIGPINNWLGYELINRWAKLNNAKTVAVHSLADSNSEAFSQGGWWSFWRNRSFDGLNKIVSVSPLLDQGVKMVFPEKAELLTLGIRDDLFVPISDEKRYQIRDELEIANDEIVFSFLGTVNERKGFDLLLEAFSGLMQENLKTKLWVIGPYTKADNQNIAGSDEFYDDQSLVSNNRIRFFGRIDDRNYLADLLASSDVFVFPSRREGFGLAPVEAMAAGVPVIVSRIEGVTDLANIDGETGLYVEVGDVIALLEAMRKLANDRELRERMGKAAYQRAVEHFGWQAHIDKWEALYSDLANEGNN